jgi:protein TonB
MKNTLIIVILLFLYCCGISQKNIDDKKIENSQRNITDTTIYTFVEIKPEYPGGDSELIKFLSSNFNCPNNNSFVTKIYFSFIIENDGSISNKEVTIRDNSVLLKTGNENIVLCKKAWIDSSLQLLNKMPNWKPAQNDGKKVRVKFLIPLHLDPQRDLWND